MFPEAPRCPATIVAAARVAALLVLCATADAQEPPRFPTTGEVVRIDAVVVDKAGHPLTGLTAEDFTVEEDGKPRPVTSFDSIVVRSATAPSDPTPVPASVSVPRTIEAEEGRALLIYFDDIHVSPQGAEWVRRNLGPFLQREVRPGDAVTIVAPHGNFWWTARTPWEHAQLPTVVARLKGQFNRNPFRDEKSDWQVMQGAEYAPKIQEGRVVGSDAFSLQREGQYGMALLRIRRTLAGLERAIASLDGFRGRKAVVIYSEGFILPPHDPFYFPEFQRTVDQCRRANVALYVADPRGLRSGGPQAEDPTSGGTAGLTGGLIDAESAGATYIAVATGGRVFSANDATEAVAQALEESKAYYLIGFQPAEGQPGERKIAVHVRGEGRRVRARNRYYWGDPLAHQANDPPSVAALRAMSDRTDVPFEVTAVPEIGSGTGPVPVHLQLQLGPMGNRERKLALLIEARPLAKAEPIHDSAEITLPPSSLPLKVERTLHLSPGVWQARVVLTDHGTDALGTALHTFRVPGPSSGGPKAVASTTIATAGTAELPKGWYRAGDHPSDYAMGLDPTGGRSGGACGFIAARVSQPAGYGTLMQGIAADEYRGKRLRLSAYVKTVGVSDWAGLWMRIDGRPKSASELPPVLGFDNMQGRPIKGTLDWRRYEIVLDVPAEAHVIGFGIMLSGSGRAWTEGLQFETVGSDVARTDTNLLPKRPKLSFED